jgi:DNA polymerase bacteriophage-type
MKIHLDFETKSASDITEVGSYKYTKDPEFDILMFAVAECAGPILLWDSRTPDTAESRKAMNMLRAATTIIAHNAMFERHVMQSGKLFFSDFGWKIPKMICTAAMCRYACLPSGLEKAAKAMNLDIQKAARGKALIKKFCIPQQVDGIQRFLFDTEQDASDWADFRKYCIQDVAVERKIYQYLKREFGIEDERDAVRLMYDVDTRINDEGIPLDMKALVNANRIVNYGKQKIDDEFRNLTGLSTTQNDAFLKWLKARGYKLDSVNAAAVKDSLEQENAPIIQKALELFRDASYSSISKVRKMIEVQHKGKVYGSFQFHGAGPGRWSGKLIQPQNFKRPSKPYHDMVFESIKDGETYEDIDMCYGPPLEAISDCMRHFIQGPLFDADFNAIEARLTCWIAWEEEGLREYRQGIDRYKRMAMKIFGVKTEAEVTKLQRFLGKTTILGCGYGLGHRTFETQTRAMMNAFGFDSSDMNEELAHSCVFYYRAYNKKIVEYWNLLEQTFRDALNSYDWVGVPTHNKNQPPILMRRLATAWGPYIQIKLPSGRRISYPRPFIEGMKIGYHPFDREKQKLYGGKIFENICQGVAADLLAYGMDQAQRDGYEIFATIHDQALAHVRDYQSVGEYVECLTKKPLWAKNFPLAAEGQETPYYTK